MKEDLEVYLTFTILIVLKIINYCRLIKKHLESYLFLTIIKIYELNFNLINSIV